MAEHCAGGRPCAAAQRVSRIGQTPRSVHVNCAVAMDIPDACLTRARLVPTVDRALTVSDDRVASFIGWESRVVAPREVLTDLDIGWQPPVPLRADTAWQSMRRADLVDSRLRVLSAGDIVDEAIGLYRRNARLFLSIGAIVLVPAGVIQLLLALLARDSASNSFAISSALWLGLSFGVSLLSYVVVISTMANAASERWLDRPMTVNDAFARVGHRIGPLTGLILLYGAVVAGLSITIVGFPFAIYLSIAWLLSIQVLLVEGTGVRAALSRSRFLVSGHWWRVIGIVILLAIIQAIISAFFSLPATILGFGSLFTDPTTNDVSSLVVGVDAVSSTIGQIVVGPIAYCAYILLYYDLRVRKEGLDIEYAARSLGLIDDPVPGQSA